MNYICFLCNLKHKTVSQLIYHLKILHNLDKESYYFCKQPSCFRDFRGLHKFRQHLNRNHINDYYNNTNDIYPCTNLELNGEKTINVHKNTCDLMNNSIVNNDIIQENSYELSEHSILLNELISSDINHDTQVVNLPPYKEKVERIVLCFIAKLISKSNITGSLLQEIIDGIINIFSSELITDLKNKIIPIIKEFNSFKSLEIENMFEVLENAFCNVKTEYHRTKTLLKNNLFLNPKR